MLGKKSFGVCYFFERTLVYQIVFKNFVLLIQQRKQKKLFVVHLSALIDTKTVYQRY